MSNKDFELKWSNNVELAKSALQQSKIQRMEVARLALEVVHIYSGTRLEYTYSLAQFAKDIGMNPHTLGSWCAVRKVVYNVLDPMERAEFNYSSMLQAVKHIGPTATVAEVRQHLKKQKATSYEFNAYKNIGVIKTLIRGLTERDLALRLEKKTLEEMKFYAEKLVFMLRSVKAKDHNLTTFGSKRRASIKQALGLNLEDQKTRQTKISDREFRVFEMIQSDPKKAWRADDFLGLLPDLSARDSQSAAGLALRKLHAVKLIDRQFVNRRNVFYTLSNTKKRWSRTDHAIIKREGADKWNQNNYQNRQNNG